MALRIWLPLNGSNINQGISGTTMSGSPASWSTNGKIGKCATFNNNTGNVIYANVTDYDYVSNDFSWAMWLTKDYASKTTSAMFAFTVGRADAGGYGYGLRVLSSTQVKFMFGTSSWDVNMADNEWHHLAFTRTGTTIRLYVDGIQSGDARTFSGTLPTYSDGKGFGVGCFHYNGSGNIYPLIGSVNDFRIYDHCLSPKEVYQISRGLCLHYKLDSFGGVPGSPNLLSWTRDYTEATPYTHTSAGKDGWKYMGNDTYIPVKPSTTYFIQLKCDGVPGTHNTSAGVVTNTFTIFGYIRKFGTTKSLGSYDGVFNLDAANIFYSDASRNLYVWKWTSNSDYQDITLRTNSYSDGSTAVTLHFWDFKVEEGASWTPYSPSVRSPEYARLGYSVNRNLAAGTSADTSSVRVAQYYTRLMYSDSYWGLESGDYFICSAYIKAPTTKGIALRIQFFTNDSTRTSIVGNVITKGQAGFSTVSAQLNSAQRGYTRMEICLTTADSSVTSDDIVECSRLKLEYGNTRTEWVPADSELPAASAGTTSTIVYDESGMGNNSLATSGSFAYTADTPRNAASLTPSQQSSIKFKLPEQMTAATYSFWIKPTTNSYKNVCSGFRNPTTNKTPWLAVNTESTGLWVYIAGISPNYHKYGSVLSNEWHHCAWVFNNGVSAWYLDGTHVGTDVTWSSFTALDNTGEIAIGDSYRGTNWSSTPMVDPISDFRVYGTALTADDIKSLYSVGATMDNSGKLYCGELDEFGSKASAQKNSVFISKGVNEPRGVSCRPTTVSESYPSGYLPTTSVYSYTPAADTSNACMNGTVICIDSNVSKYRVELDLTYSGFDTSSEAGTFNIFFQGSLRKISDSSWVWQSNPVCICLGNSQSLKNLVLSGTSGTYHYSATASFDSSWLSTYDRLYLGIRTDYSNGTGKISFTNVNVYPERDYKNRTCSINSDGTVSTKELDEALF